MPFTRQHGSAFWKAARDVAGRLLEHSCVERYMRVRASHFVGFSQRDARAAHGKKKSMDASVTPSEVPLVLGSSAVDVAPAQQLDISAWLLRHLS